MPTLPRTLPALVALSLLAGAALAEERPAARETVGRPVQQAQALLKQKKAEDALQKLRETDAVKDRTAYETYVVEETRAAALVEARRFAEALKALDAALATGMLPPAERPKRLMSEVQLAYELKDDAAVIDRAERYYREGGTERTPRLLMAQAQYLVGDFTNASRTIRILLEADAKAGATPGEELLLTLASSEAKRQDEAGYRDALARLVRAYPKPGYWTDLLAAVERAPAFARRLALDLERLRAAAGAMAEPAQAMAAAELALAQGFPGDAKAFLDRAAGGPGERQKRLAQMAARQSLEDAAALAALAKEAEAAANGRAFEKLGQAYGSYGRYDEAIAAFERALAKGGLEHPEDARLHLGMALLGAGKIDRAEAALAAVGEGSAGELARLWLLRGAG